MFRPIIIARAWSSYDHTAFTNKMLIRYQERAVVGLSTVLRFRTELDAFRSGEPLNKLFTVVNWTGVEPRAGELLVAGRGQEKGKVVIVVARILPDPHIDSWLRAPQVNVTIVNITSPTLARAAIESTVLATPQARPATYQQQHTLANAQADPSDTAEVEYHTPHDRLRPILNLHRQRQTSPGVQVKTETEIAHAAHTEEEHDIVDLTWISDSEEDVKPTIPDLEPQPEASTATQPVPRTRGKRPTCPNKKEIRAMAQYVMSRPAGADMEDPEEWVTFVCGQVLITPDSADERQDPRRSIYAWANIYVKRKTGMCRLGGVDIEPNVHITLRDQTTRGQSQKEIGAQGKNVRLERPHV